MATRKNANKTSAGQQQPKHEEQSGEDRAPHQGEQKDQGGQKAQHKAGQKTGGQTAAQQRQAGGDQQHRDPESKVTHKDKSGKDFAHQRGDRRQHPDVGEQEDVNDELMEDELLDKDEDEEEDMI